VEFKAHTSGRQMLVLRKSGKIPRYCVFSSHARSIILGKLFTYMHPCRLYDITFPDVMVNDQHQNQKITLTPLSKIELLLFFNIV
jgi:hypothetical protein